MMQLRRLEEKGRLPESYFKEYQGGRNNQLNADMDDLREALLDRLNLLENRIHQLSQELDGGGRFSGGDHNNPTAIKFPAERQRQILSNTQSQMSQKKVHSDSMPKRLVRSICSYIFCTDESCSLESQLPDDCDGRGIHADCYH